MTLPTEEWRPDQLGALHALVGDAFDEDIEADDLRAVLFDPGVPRVVLAADGAGVVAAGAHGAIGSIDLLAVHPAHRRQGLASGLLAAAVDWCRAHGCGTVNAGGRPPFYLWPGVDREWMGALAVLERAGFRRGEAILDLSCPTDVPRHTAPGVDVGAPGVAEQEAALEACRTHFEHWVAELARGIERGRALVAVDHVTGDVLGFACHGVSRRGWFGPTGTFPEARGRGVGTALLHAALDEMRRDGFAECEIAWVGPVAFYAAVAPVRAGRTFVVHRLEVSDHPEAGRRER